MSSKKRKYSDSYIAFGFTWIGDADSPNPQCVVCGEVLANSSLKHSHLQDMPMSFFQGKLEELQKKKKIIHSHSGLGASKNAQKASYLASYHIAKRGMPHTIGENLCLPVTKDMVNCMLGEKAAKTLDKIPLSDNTVARRIDSISADILSQLISRIKNSEVNESTDITNLSNLLVYVRAVAFIRKVAPSISWVHCSIHREALAMKNIEHETLLLHTEVRWLSRGKVLAKIFELRCEVQEFFAHNPFHLSSCLQDDIWLQKLAYLAYICSALNELNLSLQGLSTTVFNTQDKVEALIKKLVFWASWINTNSTECFPLLSEFLQSREAVLNDCIKGLITEHLKKLSQNLHEFGILLMSLLQSHISHFKSKKKYWTYHLMGDTTYFLKNKSISQVDFWASAMVECPGLSKQALKVLMPFATTYICEAGFSALTLLKTKHRQRLDAENDLRVKLSSITPNFDNLCANMQAHPSH
uniref:HAT C-terminal dimerisation domain-containing protein n=1 Tax=Sinocyclocheilus grahami TaxID=75366 RepID=A0A672M114_SINGR